MHVSNRALAALVFSVGLIGCGGWSTTTPAVYGPYPHESEGELVAMVAEAIETRGYDATEVDVERGRIAVDLNSAHAECYGRPPRAIFRFFQGGWVQVLMQGCGTHRRQDGSYAARSEVNREYVGLVDFLLEPARD